MACIRKRGSKYHVQVRRKGFAPATRTFHKISDAQEWARHIEIKADRGDLPTSASDLTQYKVRHIVERYRDEISIRKLSYNSEVFILNAFLKLPMSDFTLARFSPPDLSAYRDKRLKQVKPGTVNREFAILKHAFDMAIQEWNTVVTKFLTRMSDN